MAADTDDRELIAKARRGDRDAIASLYSRYAARVYGIARRLAGDDGAAEDWAQEAWVRILRGLPRFRGESRFTTWMHRIVVNSALHGRRGQTRRLSREVPLELEAEPCTSDDPGLLRIRLERALDQLPDGMRQVLVLHDVEGYTHEEIAELLGVAPGTSKSQLFKARARMRSMLGSGRAAVGGGEEGICHT